MKKINVSREDVERVIKSGLNVLVFTASLVLPYLSAKRDTTMIENAGYSDAVSAIMKSTMYSHDKEKAVSFLTKDSDTEVYKAVIQVVRSTMYSHDKVKVIHEMCNK